MQSPVFLLGVGAQKAGTSWLWQYLKRHPQCAIGEIKEYAIFNSVMMADTFPLRKRMRLKRLSILATQRLTQLEAGAEPDDHTEFLALMDNIALELDMTRYVPHFQDLLRRQPGTRLVADITPEYCALSPDDFRTIRTMLTDGGFEVRVVYLMRDPVERCYSMMRMGERNAAREGAQKRNNAHERFAREAVQPWNEIRTRYDNTIRVLEQVFAPHELHFEFYERFISAEGTRALTSFLGIDFVEPNLEFRANASPRGSELGAESIAIVREFYDPVYRFCADRFGADTVRELWKHA